MANNQTVGPKKDTSHVSISDRRTLDNWIATRIMALHGLVPRPYLATICHVVATSCVRDTDPGARTPGVPARIPES